VRNSDALLGFNPAVTGCGVNPGVKSPCMKRALERRSILATLSDLREIDSLVHVEVHGLHVQLAPGSYAGLA
jgi:hypothetical protein